MADEEPGDNELPKLGIGASAADVRRWIRQVCDILKITPSQLAKKASISHTTVNRFLSQKDGDKHLSGATLESLTTAVALEGLDLRLGVITNKHVQKRVDEINAARLAPFFDNSGECIGSIAIAGSIGKGLWVSDETLFKRKGEMLRLPLPFPAASDDIIAFKLAEETNSDFHKGSLILCYFGEKFPETLEFKYVARVELSDAESEVKIYKCVKGPNKDWWLIPTWNAASRSDQIYIGSSLRAGINDLADPNTRFRVIITAVQPYVHFSTDSD